MPSCGASTWARWRCSVRNACSARRSPILPARAASWDLERTSPSASWANWRYSASAVCKACSDTSSRLASCASSRLNSNWPCFTISLGCTWICSTTPSMGARSTAGCAATSSPGASTVRCTGQTASTATAATAHTTGRRHQAACACCWRRCAHHCRGDAMRRRCKARHAWPHMLHHSPNTGSRSAGNGSAPSSSRPAEAASPCVEPGVPGVGCDIGNHTAWAGHHCDHCAARSGGTSAAVKTPSRGWCCAMCRHTCTAHWA